MYVGNTEKLDCFLSFCFWGASPSSTWVRLLGGVPSIGWGVVLVLEGPPKRTIYAQS